MNKEQFLNHACFYVRDHHLGAIKLSNQNIGTKHLMDFFNVYDIRGIDHITEKDKEDVFVNIFNFFRIDLSCVDDFLCLCLDFLSCDNVVRIKRRIRKSIEARISIEQQYFLGCTDLKYVTIGRFVMSIGDSAFNGCVGLMGVYYCGLSNDWTKISIGHTNAPLTSATRYYYSETQPTTTGNYWHYVEGVPTKW